MIVKYQEQMVTNEEHTAKASFIIDTILGDTIITTSSMISAQLGNYFSSILRIQLYILGFDNLPRSNTCTLNSSLSNPEFGILFDWNLFL